MPDWKPLVALNIYTSGKQETLSNKIFWQISISKSTILYIRAKTYLSWATPSHLQRVAATSIFHQHIIKKLFQILTKLITLIQHHPQIKKYSNNISWDNTKCQQQSYHPSTHLHSSPRLLASHKFLIRVNTTTFCLADACTFTFYAEIKIPLPNNNIQNTIQQQKHCTSYPRANADYCNRVTNPKNAYKRCYFDSFQTLTIHVLASSILTYIFITITPKNEALKGSTWVQQTSYVQRAHCLSYSPCALLTASLKELEEANVKSTVVYLKERSAVVQCDGFTMATKLSFHQITSRSEKLPGVEGPKG